MIQHKTIDGLLLRDMVVAGAALLEKNREAVDALNVFPVPDGDTGTNMSLTMQIYPYQNVNLKYEFGWIKLKKTELTTVEKLFVGEITRLFR